MNEKRILRNRSAASNKSVDVSRAKYVCRKNKRCEKENCLPHTNLKDDISDEVITESQNIGFQYKKGSKRRIVKQNCIANEDFLPMKKSNCVNKTKDKKCIKRKDSMISNISNKKQIVSDEQSSQNIKSKRNPILSSVENIFSEKVLIRKEKNAKTSLNLEKVPIWKRDLHLLNPRKKRHCVDVYDITLDDEIASNEGQLRNVKIHSTKNNKVNENSKKKKRLLHSNKHLKLPKEKVLNSKSDKKPALETDQVSVKEQKSIETDKFVSQVLDFDQNECHNEMSTEQNAEHNSISTSAPVDTIENIECTLTNLCSSESNSESNKMYLSNLADELEKSFSIPIMTSTPDGIHLKTGLQTQKNKVVSITSISDIPEIINNSAVVTSSDGIPPKIGVQTQESNVIVDISNNHENNNNFTVTASTHDTIHSKPEVQTEKKKDISITDISDFPENKNSTVLTSTPGDSHMETRVQNKNNKRISVDDILNIPDNNKDCLISEVISPVYSSYEVLPQMIDKDDKEITLFESPKKQKSKGKNDVKRISPQKTIQINLFGEVLQTPSSTDSLEDSVIMPKRTYHSPDYFKAHLFQTKKQNEKTKKEEAKKSKQDLLIEKMSRHFDEIENTELCIE